jgi:hypothetical protein
LRSRGFNPGLGNSRRCALEAHQNPARHIESKSFARVSFTLAPPSGRIFNVAGTQGFKQVLNLGQQIGHYPQITQITQIFLDTGLANVWSIGTLFGPTTVRKERFAFPEDLDFR